MPDVLTPDQRAHCMSRIQGKHTKPEMLVRTATHALGFRYRLHVSTLPGCPDLVFAGRRKVIFVHGCFWHRHDCPYGRPVPATRPEFWQAKFAATTARDSRVLADLAELGWSVLVVWECETRDAAALAARLGEFLRTA